MPQGGCVSGVDVSCGAKSGSVAALGDVELYRMVTLRHRIGQNGEVFGAAFGHRIRKAGGEGAAMRHGHADVFDFDPGGCAGGFGFDVEPRVGIPLGFHFERRGGGDGRHEACADGFRRQGIGAHGVDAHQCAVGKLGQFGGVAQLARGIWPDIGHPDMRGVFDDALEAAGVGAVRGGGLATQYAVHEEAFFALGEGHADEGGGEVHGAV